ncbi:hypothetical protein PILCRDRAFT_662133 [Piloderma croceum F 1598]|uniref:Uncharacterized protein n=1 Tax=Piloderma croceum (strain F 1598) TaxID=765440 RepID=A0A0C3APJ7_PILCF|nr:hypothetical protein PILCRDRAFT_662133 [Piloderma croceum F 1598]
MYSRLFFLFLFLARKVICVQITHPVAGSNWTTSGPNIISWKADNGDPPFVDIQLVQNNQSSFRPIPGLLPADGIIATDIEVKKGCVDFLPFCFPTNSSFPAGSGYSLRLLSNEGNKTYSVLNSTQPFHIVDANATSCIGIQPSTNLPSTASSTAVPLNISTLQNTLSSSTSNSHTAAIAGGFIGGLAIFDLLVCGAIIYNRRLRNARRRKTQQCLMKTALAAGKSTEISSA